MAGAVGRWVMVVIVGLALVASEAQARKHHAHRFGHRHAQRVHVKAHGHGKHHVHASRGKHTRHAHRGSSRRGVALGGLHPVAQSKLSAAFGEMRRRGLSPHITSAFRSTAQQQGIFRCSHSRRCRVARGIYGARRPGSSTHEAGLAVDIAGISARGRGKRRCLSRPGAAIVRIMRRHDFSWRYGLRDPAHFELSPGHAGYRTTHAAIVARQSLVSERRARSAQLLARKSLHAKVRLARASTRAAERIAKTTKHAPAQVARADKGTARMAPETRVTRVVRGQATRVKLERVKAEPTKMERTKKTPAKLVRVPRPAGTALLAKRNR